MAPAAAACPPPPVFTFTQGVLLGQASMILLAMLFIKFVVFEDSDRRKRNSGRSTAAAHKRHRRHSSANAALLPDSDILKELSYDLSTAPLESARWLNVFLGQVIASYRSLILSRTAEDGGAKGFVEKAVNARLGDNENPAYVCLDHVDVKDVDFGNSFPVFSNMRIRPRDDTGSLRIDMDVDYSDNVCVSIDTRVLVNFPRPKFAVLPVSLSLSLVKFSATVSLEIQPDAESGTPSACISLHPDFSLELTSSSLIGARAKLQDIPKVEQLVAGRLRGFIIDKLVWPRKIAVKLPDIGHAAHAVQEDFVLIDKDTDEDSHEEADSDPILDELLGPPIRPAKAASARPPFDNPPFTSQTRLSPLLAASFDGFQRHNAPSDENEAMPALPGHLPSYNQQTSSSIRYRQRPLSMSQSMYSS